LAAALNYSGGDIISFYFAKHFEGAQPSIPTVQQVTPGAEEAQQVQHVTTGDA